MGSSGSGWVRAAAVLVVGAAVLLAAPQAAAAGVDPVRGVASWLPDLRLVQVDEENSGDADPAGDEGPSGDQGPPEVPEPRSELQAPEPRSEEQPAPLEQPDDGLPQAPEEGTDPEPPDDGDADTNPDPTEVGPDAEEVVRPASRPAVTTSTIPLSSIVVAIVVLLASVLALLALLRASRAALSRAPMVAATRCEPSSPPDAPAVPVDAAPVATAPGAAAPRASPPGSSAEPATADLATLDLLILLGAALLDAGDAVNHVEEALIEVARVNGATDVGVIVLPTALIVSVTGGGTVQTEVTRAGTARLRLDQADAVFRLAQRARRGDITPAQGQEQLAQIRSAPPLYSQRTRLLGYVGFAIGLALLLRGGWMELLVAGLLGVVIGNLQLYGLRLDRAYHAFLPVVGAFVAAVVVFGLGRALPELSVFPPLVAPLVVFLPGALLTIAVYELATGQILSGAGRLAAGILQLVLLGLGIVAGAQLLGVPAAVLTVAGTSAVSVALPWLGVAVFGVGVVLFNGARLETLPWILVVLYVAYAGQVIGGLFFGSALSAFVGAMVMTPVAMLAARQPSGPPTLVSFLPGFWLLVPGAMGLAGVTSLLEEDRVEGLTTLVGMATSMVGITLGVLLGLAIGGHLTALVTRWTTQPEADLAG